jgi:hypothetical protein
MYPSTGRVGYPVAKTRLFMSIPAGVFFGFLLFGASVYLKWFTVIRGFYPVLGVIEGLLIGRFEVQTVINNLTGHTETMVWQTLPISTVLFGMPFLLAMTIFGVSEYLPFMAYVVLSFVPVYYATTGWYFNKFEKKNKVRILMSPYGFKYWTEPILDISERFYHFIRDVASKDAFSLGLQAGYSKKFITKLEERQDINPSTRKTLLDILKVMNKNRQRMLLVFAVFLVSMPLVIFWLSVLTSTHTFGLEEVVGGRIVSGREITLVLGCVPFFSVFGGSFAAVWLLRKRFQERISSLLINVDSDKLYTIL